MESSKLNRRKFIRRASLGTLGAGMVSAGSFAAPEPLSGRSPAVIKEYRKFGNTSFMVSDFSCGAPGNEAVLRALLEKGVNLIDTGETYMNGNSERIIGRVMQDFDRSRIFINSKLYTEKEFPSKKEVLERSYQAMERLQTDYIDCMQIHSAEDSGILKDEAFHSAMEQLKKEGRIRHVGVSCHGNNWAYDTEESLDTILMSAIEDGRFDVILLAYNFANAGIAEKVLEACEKRGIATMIMKSNPIHIYNIFESRMERLADEGKEADAFLQAYYDKYKLMDEQAKTFFASYGLGAGSDLKKAASRYVLSNPLAHTTLWDFQNFDEVDNMLQLSGQRLTADDRSVLGGFEKHLGHTVCRIGCNDCEAACPHHLPVNKILRYNYYFSVKKQEKMAMEKYAGLNLNRFTELCVDCNAYCEQACTYGVWTRPLLAAARVNLEMV